MIDKLVYDKKEYVVKYQHTRRGIPQHKCITRWFYGRPYDAVTRAYIILSYEPFESIYAEAFCSRKDHFCKKIGRMIALGRLKKKLEENEM